MKVTFLGTGAAWRLPEHSCDCAVCAKMRLSGEQRLRTSLLVETAERLLIDCGPDIQLQMKQANMVKPDAVLITHEHGDHFLGLDDLLVYKRSLPTDHWKPIPVYATTTAWRGIEARFGYLIGSLLEPRVAVPGTALEGLETSVTPFETFHGPSAAGSVGYVITSSTETGKAKLVYTSDFIDIPEEPEILREANILVMQSHWFNEPEFNRPFHMSFQKAMDFIHRWRCDASYLVHISDGEAIPDDLANSYMKKSKPQKPLAPPAGGSPYAPPRDQSEWQERVAEVARDFNLPGDVLVAYDGLVVEVGSDDERREKE